MTESDNGPHELPAPDGSATPTIPVPPPVPTVPEPDVGGGISVRSQEAEVDVSGGRHFRHPVLWTTIICTLAAAGGHTVLWLASAFGWDTGPGHDVTWQPVVGISLSIVGVASFGGFYLASRRARVAIAASFLLTFLVSLTFIMTLQGLATDLNNDAKEIFKDFLHFNEVIIGFYFGSEAIVSATKAVAVSRTTNDPTAVQRADRDLVA
jgi:hypothetical protein